MGTMRTNWRGLGILSALSLAGATGACKTVSPDELDLSLAALREEMTQQMRSGDGAVSQQLGGRIGTVEQRTAALETDLGQLEQDFEVAITRLAGR